MLEQQHHRNVAQNAKRERKAEALDRCAGQEEQRERGNKRYQVGVNGGQNAVAHARDGRGAHAAPMRISSRKRSMVRMDESAAMPMVSTMPQCPAGQGRAERGQPSMSMVMVKTSMTSASNPAIP